MSLPFTVEQFLDVFRHYNVSVFPLQIVFNVLGVIAILIVFRRRAHSGVAIAAILAFLWFWMGGVYHLLFFTTINPAAYGFGILNITQGCMFLFYGIYWRKLTFRFQQDVYGWTGALLMTYALVIYPLLGYSLGHVYPANPTFGLPCPTTIFTFGLFLWTDRRFPLVLLVIPFLWSVIGFSAAFSLGIREDTGLLIAGIISVTLVLVRKRIKHTER